MTQNLRRPDDLHAYVHAHQQAFAWAEKAVRLRSAAKTAQANAAAGKARQWLKIISELEPQRNLRCISLTVTPARAAVVSNCVSASIDKPFGRSSRQPVRKRLSLLSERQ
jgi:hypothetical protein